METMPKTPNNEYIKPTLSGKSVPELVARESEMAEAHDQQLIEEAIRNIPDKEPFDYVAFSKLYWRKDSEGGDVSPKDSPNIQEAYRKRYYLDFVDTLTMEEFAHALEELDAQSGN